MLAVLQYTVYFLVGALLLVVMGSYFSVAAGFTILAVGLLYLPLFLASYASGLSFFYPRIAAVASIILVLPFFVSGIYHMFVPAVAFEPTIFVGPASVVILISIFALLWSKTSLWSRQKKSFGKVAIGIFALLPALLGTLMLVSSLIKIGRSLLRPSR